MHRSRGPAGWPSSRRSINTVSYVELLWVNWELKLQPQICRLPQPLVRAVVLTKLNHAVLRYLTKPESEDKVLGCTGRNR